MNFPFFRPRRDAQVWPCGPDCIYARPHHTQTGDWIWCERPEASERMRHAGGECPEFRSTGGLPGTIAAPSDHSAGIFTPS
jgi:hypothetical protein